MGTRFVTATEFKAKCLSILDEISTKGGSVTVTKRGRPMATLGPVQQKAFKTSAGMLKGKVDISDELLMADTSHLWNVVREIE